MITARITFQDVHPKSGDTGDMEKWITDRIYFEDYVEAPAVAGAIMNQIQFANLGADLYNGTLIL
jgi:hypothetical protein